MKAPGAREFIGYGTIACFVLHMGPICSTKNTNADTP